MNALRGHISAFVFDFDQTLADTSALQPLRESRNWGACNREAPRIAFYDGVFELLETLSSSGGRLYIASSAPQKYLTPFVERLPRVFSKVLGYRSPGERGGLSHRAAIKADQLREIRTLEGAGAELLHVGDDGDDASAASRSGAQYAHACWGAPCSGLPGVHSESPRALLKIISGMKG